MIKPRDLLLNKHQAAQPALDRLRAEVIRAEVGAEPPGRGRWPGVLWRELIQPCRFAWGGLAATWLVILSAHVVARDASPVTVMATAPRSPEVQVVLREQALLRAELLGRAEPVEAERRKSRRMEPRSEWLSNSLMG